MMTQFSLALLSCRRAFLAPKLGFEIENFDANISGYYQWGCIGKADSEIASANVKLNSSLPSKEITSQARQRRQIKPS